MFRRNDSHRQPGLFGVWTALPPAKAQRLRDSWAGAYYNLVFIRIDEEVFAVLYDDGTGRPNSPVNCMVSAIILQQRYGWSCQELFEHIAFDLQTRVALGVTDIEQEPFCEATYFNFRNRLLKHWVNTGQNLLETVFDSLTAEQLKELKLNTEVQRSDSFQALSNIFSYNRVQLLVEVLIRLHRALSAEQKQRFSEVLEPFISAPSGRYVHRLEKSAIPHELEKLGQVYHRLHTELSGQWRSMAIFKLFERVYEEHFTVVSDRVQVKDSKEIDPDSLQAPDDPEATFHRKGGKSYRGRTVNVTETASPENDVQLITDVAVEPNTASDSAVLNERAECLADKTPDLKELHTDSNYGSPANDRLLDELGILHVTTGIQGIRPKVPMQIDELAEGWYTVRCPLQTVQAAYTRTRFKAEFDAELCADCRLAEGCQAVLRAGGSRTLYFDRSQCLVNMRGRNIETIPKQRRKVRANIEATVREFTAPFNHRGKLKVRGMFSTMMYAFGMAISINFGRVWRHQNQKGENGGPTPSQSALHRPLKRSGIGFLKTFAALLGHLSSTKTLRTACSTARSRRADTPSLRFRAANGLLAA